MTFWDFANQHPYVTLCIALSITFTMRRVLRHLNIRKHGYPPPHCDADGDFRGED
jgi:hypothetical protein